MILLLLVRHVPLPSSYGCLKVRVYGICMQFPSSYIPWESPSQMTSPCIGTRTFVSKEHAIRAVTTY